MQGIEHAMLYCLRVLYCVRVRVRALQPSPQPSKHSCSGGRGGGACAAKFVKAHLPESRCRRICDFCKHVYIRGPSAVCFRTPVRLGQWPMQHSTCMACQLNPSEAHKLD